MIRPGLRWWMAVSMLLGAILWFVTAQSRVVGEEPLEQPRAKDGLRLTVANVRGDTALLFTMSPAGKLKFVRKVPTGEAADLDTAAGVRWYAIFGGDPPGCEEFTPSSSDYKWILRAPE